MHERQLGQELWDAVAKKLQIDLEIVDVDLLIRPVEPGVILVTPDDHQLSGGDARAIHAALGPALQRAKEQS